MTRIEESNPLRVTIPEHVVFRTFVEETVVLNLEAGAYHGLNRTAGRMLELLDELGEMEVVIDRLVEETGAPADRVARGPACLLRVPRRERSHRGGARRLRVEGDCAVGLRFTGAQLPGLVAGVEDDLPTVAVELGAEADLDERWAESATAPDLIYARSYADGRPFLRIEQDDSAGYRVWALGYGSHLISVAGDSCASSLAEGPAWRGLRLLASQAMPLIATLRGHEVMHAAGVVVDERLVGLVAASGTGKSSTACNLIAQGGRFFADDVLALDTVGGRIRAHPGPRLVSVHARDLGAIADGLRARIGERLDESDKVYLEPAGFPGSLPLHALVFLNRRPGNATATVISEPDNLPMQLLGNAFVSYIDRPARLVRQLEVTSTLARTVPLGSVDIATGDDASTVARRIAEWLETTP